MTDVPSLARAAQNTHVVVIGAGLAGLVAAYRCAEIGMPVTVLESTDHLGGTLRTQDIAGHQADVLASHVTLTPDATALLSELGLTTTKHDPKPRTTITASGVHELPDGVLGIPANPFDPRVVAITGWGGAWRGYLDRLRPVLTIGHQKQLDTLVRSRMGRKIADRLVAPLVRGSFGIGVADVDVDEAAPSLNAALTRMGNLTGAVADVMADVAPTRHTIAGGVQALPDALVARLRDLGADIRTNVDGLELTRTAAGFTVTIPDDEAPEPLTADLLIIATDEEAARELLPSVGVSVPGDNLSRPAITVTLAVSAQGVPDLGAGAVTQLDEPAVWAIDDAVTPTATERVLRVRLSPAVAERTDEEIVNLAISEAGRLLQTNLRVNGHSVARASGAAPASRIGHEGRQQAARAAVAAVPGLGVVGGWVGGSGIARVIADATDSTEALRRSALFG